MRRGAEPGTAGPRPPSRAGDRTRTGDPDLGKVVLYQLSYSRVLQGTEGRKSAKEGQDAYHPRIALVPPPYTSPYLTPLRPSVATVVGRS